MLEPDDYALDALPGVGQGDGVASEGGPSLGAEFSRENGKWLTQFVGA